MIQSERPSRILVIRFSSMGDIVLTSPVTRQLSRICPDAELDFLTRDEYAPLARALPGVARVQCFEPEQGHWRLVARLRRRRYDLAIDLHGNIRSRLVGLAGMARRVIRYDKRRFARMAIVRRRRRSRSVPHTVDRYLEVLGSVLAPPEQGDGSPEGARYTGEHRIPELIVRRSAVDEVANRLAEAGIGPDAPVLGVAPGASHGPKRWPPERFARVADHMARSRDMTILLLGSEGDRPVAGEVARVMGRQAVDWTGTTDLSLLPAAVQRCALLVSNDSGPMHVATAVGTPVVGVFGATHPRLGFAPVGPADAAVTLDLSCSPCSLHGNRACRFRTHACMEELDPRRVISEAECRIPV
ncbi:MAG: lipopolysaccharide heptosyltransferase II [Gemmatimonadetes bacterium]|nr:lipopolysaccharide heptosyltransferase II [Gemmatimonadota bacterium]